MKKFTIAWIIVTALLFVLALFFGLWAIWTSDYTLHSQLGNTAAVVGFATFVVGVGGGIGLAIYGDILDGNR